MPGEKSTPPTQQSGFQHSGPEYIEIDLRNRGDGLYIKPAGSPRLAKLKIFTALICGLAAGAAIASYFARPRQASPNAESLDVPQSPAAWVARSFYLSKAGVPGGSAASACSVGFHMASIYEVLNVSALRYNTALGLETGDSGQGPPGLSLGWAKTGLVGDALHTCNGWTSSAPGLYQGFAIRLNALAGIPAPAFGLQPWEFLGFGDKYNSASCDTRHSVWCVQD